LFDGARDAIDAVRKIGLGLGMATSSSRREVDAFLERFELDGCFDITLSLDDVTAAKPDPEVYVKAARLLGVPVSAMLVVEDSKHGVRAAKDAGATCVAVRSPHVLPEQVADADLFVDSVGEVPGLLGATG
jgi:HAD superfamily hydrolase (TIGR01509 family)